MDTFKFPGGKDVTVVRKQDVIECIDTNIVDKDVALAIIEQCELDAAGFLRQGRWTGIPFIGSIRASRVAKLHNSKEQKELIDYVRNNASTEHYVLFRKNLAADNEKRVKATRHFGYVLAMAVARDRIGFKKLCKERGEKYARIHYFLTYNITALDNESIFIDDAENSYNR